MFDVLADPLRELASALDKVEACEGRLDVVELSRLADRLEFLRVRALGTYDASEEWRADGYVTAAAAVRDKCRISHGAAAAALTLARRLELLPETAAAFAAGEISRDHARAISDACTPARVAAIREVEAQLVELARAHSPRTVRRVVRRLADALDGDGGYASDEAQHARRYLHLSRTLDDMGALDGMLDPEGTEIVAAAFKAEMKRDFSSHDTRTPAQRRADALVNICRQALGTGSLGVSRRVRPQLSVVEDLAELRESTGLGLRVPRGPFSRATLERLACDCEISRVIIDGPSEVLDVGRATRTVPPAIWKALVVRDRCCTAPGCEVPAEFCEAHHQVHWLHGGETRLENLVLLCPRHHRGHHDPARAP